MLLLLAQRRCCGRAVPCSSLIRPRGASSLLLWRDRQGGGREGLALSAHACSNPKCACRDVVIEGWSVGANLSGVTCTENKFTSAAA